MLDGFVIKGNESEQVPSTATLVNTNASHRNYVSIAISILVHLLLACLLYIIAEKEQIKPERSVKKAIKSYLYFMPTKNMPTKEVELSSEAQEIKIRDNLATLKQKPPFNAEIKTAEIKTAENSSTVKPKKSIQPTAAIPQVKPKPKSQNPTQASFSVYKQLNNLRNTINEQAMLQELTELQQFRSPSVMHGEQASVPHSFAQLTPEQERKKNTTKMSNDISITKYEDGSCTIDREQFLGSPVEGSSSAFACGESKFDKSFREHMKKVQEKILPQR